MSMEDFLEIKLFRWLSSLRQQLVIRLANHAGVETSSM